MEALTASSAALSSRPQICFLGYLKSHVHLRFPASSLSLSLHRKTIQPISSAPAFTASESQPQTSAANEEILTEDTTQVKTVHVKFQLHRECLFGQQFLVVGDDPMFGLWDPSSAIPLNWSEGHLWTVEMDMPCDKVMKYKFILKGGDGAILWQPGPDRILQTWETGKTITVCEDWDNAELQTIKEEDCVTLPLPESTDNSEMLKVNENMLQPSGDSGSLISEELTSANGYSQPTEKPLAEKPMAIVAENITEQNGEKEVEVNDRFPGAEFTNNANEAVTLGMKEDSENSGRSGSSENLIVLEDGNSGVAIPVLVPGLPPIPTAETEEASVSKADNHISTNSSSESYKAQESNVPELSLKEEPAIDSPIPNEETQTLLNDKLELHEKVHVQEPQLSEEDQPDSNGVDGRVLKSDIQWGRRTLQQFLVNLGLL